MRSCDDYEMFYFYRCYRCHRCYRCKVVTPTVTKGVKTRRFSFSIRTAMISFFTLCGMLKRGQSLLKREHYPADFKIFFGLPCLYFSGGVYQLQKQIKGNKTKGALPQGHTIHCLISSNNIAFNLSSFFSLYYPRPKHRT